MKSIFVSQILNFWLLVRKRNFNLSYILISNINNKNKKKTNVLFIFLETKKLKFVQKILIPLTRVLSSFKNRFISKNTTWCNSTTNILFIYTNEKKMFHLLGHYTAQMLLLIFSCTNELLTSFNKRTIKARCISTNVAKKLY